MCDKIVLFIVLVCLSQTVIDLSEILREWIDGDNTVRSQNTIFTNVHGKNNSRLIPPLGILHSLRKMKKEEESEDEAEEDSGEEVEMEDMFETPKRITRSASKVTP